LNSPQRKQSPIVVVDVGARSGVQAIWVKARYPVLVLGFEPDAEECDALNARSSDASDRAVLARYFPWALAEGRSKRSLYLYKDRRLSSFYLPNEALLSQFPIPLLLSEGAFSVDAKVDLDCISLDEFCQQEKVAAVDFIKLDTQGSELEILRGGDKILDRVFGIAVEVEFSPLYAGQPLFGDIDAYLTSKGFSLFDLNRHWWKRTTEHSIESRGQVMFADAIYLRDPALSSSPSYWDNLQSDSSGIERIVALSSVLGYSDFALALLNHFKNTAFIDGTSFEALSAKYVRRRDFPPVPQSSRSIWARAVAKVRRAIGSRISKMSDDAHYRHLHQHYYDNDERKGLR
jgi:FkbM family methyltransferase